MKAILTIVLSWVVLSVTAQTNYSRGFEKGYPVGYCYGQGYSCVPPVTPVTPIPLIGETYDSYTDGYNRGFAEGQKDRVAGNSNNAASYPTSQQSKNVYANPTYVPKVEPFKPDYDFYLRAYQIAQQNQQAYQIQQQQQQAYIAYQRQLEYNKRLAYVNSIDSIYQRIAIKPDSIPEGYYKILLVTKDDYSTNIKVYVKGNKITNYYYDDYYEAKVLETSPIAKGKTTIKIETMGITTGTMKVYFMEYMIDPTKKENPPLRPSFFCLYTESKKVLKYHLYVDGFYLGKLSDVWDSSEKPTYGAPGTISFYLKPGTHTITVTKGIYPNHSWLRMTTGIGTENGMVIFKVEPK